MKEVFVSVEKGQIMSELMQMGLDEKWLMQFSALELKEFKRKVLAKEV